MLEKAFATIDLFGIPILLNFSKSQKAKSAFGGFCSLLFLGFVIWSIYNSGYELFARQKPQIIDGTLYQETPRPIEISSKSLPVAFGIQTSDSLIGSKYCVHVYSLDGSQNNVRPMERCTPEHFNRNAESMNGFEYSNYSCLPLVPDPTPVKALTVFAFCLPGDKATEFFLQSPTALVVYPKNGLTLHDYHDPVQLYYDSDFQPLIAGTTIMSMWSLTHLNISTDDGWLTENEKVREYIQVTNDMNRNVQTLVLTAVGYVFNVSQQETYYLRSYKRLQSVLAEVGGIANTVFTALSIIVMPYARIKFSESFVNELFEIKRKNQYKKAATKTSNRKNDLVQTPNAPKLQKVVNKNQVAKSNNKQKLEMKNQESKRTLKTENITVEKEYQFGISIKRKASEGLIKSQQGENEGLLQKRRQQEKQNHLLKPKMDVDLPERQFPYRKVQTQPVELVPLHGLENSSQDDKDNRENDAFDFIKLDDLVLPFESQIKFKSDDKSTTNVKEVKQNMKGQQNEFESHSVSQKKEGPVAEDDLQNHEALEIAKWYGKTEIPQGPGKKVPSKRNKMKRTGGIKISLLEYCWSFVSRSGPLTEKMTILKEGIKIFDERLDIFNLLKKLRDVDKIKGLLLDKEQLFLFDRTTRPDILDRASHWYLEEFLPFESYDMKFGSVDDKMIKVKQGIIDKPEKSEIDEKLLAVISDSNS